MALVCTQGLQRRLQEIEEQVEEFFCGAHSVHVMVAHRFLLQVGTD